RVRDERESRPRFAIHVYLSSILVPMIKTKPKRYQTLIERSITPGNLEQKSSNRCENDDARFLSRVAYAECRVPLFRCDAYFVIRTKRAFERGRYKRPHAK